MIKSQNPALDARVEITQNKANDMDWKNDLIKQAIAKIVRVCTVAPIFAAIILIAMWASGQLTLVAGITAACCLVALPLLSYPVQLIIPPLKAKGRKGQRDLAIVFSVVGYVVLAALSLALGFTAEIRVLAFTYLFSGILILLTSFSSLKCSGHASGIAGPIVYLSYFVSPYFAFLAIVLVAVAWSSVVLKRHTIWEFVGGSIVPVVAFALSCVIFL